MGLKMGGIVSASGAHATEYQAEIYAIKVHVKENIGKGHMSIMFPTVKQP